MSSSSSPGRRREHRHGDPQPRALAVAAPHERLLDVGCDDGQRTRSFAVAAGATQVFGAEAIGEQAAKARERGIEVTVADAGTGLPYPDASFDAVVSNQVIEHLLPASWRHVQVFAYRGLRELFEGHGFYVRELVGAGYYPLPAAFGRRDSRHAAFLTVAARKA